MGSRVEFGKRMMDLNEPEISVIIDAYNYGIYLEDAIVSALQQTLPRERYEIIVVDDGSTDDTRQRVANYLPNVIYHYKENGGQASAINAGLALARGEFVAFLDADDYWAPEKLSTVLEKFRNDRFVDVVYHTLCIVDKEKRKRGVFPQWFGQVIADKPIENYRNWLTVIGTATSGIAWRASALRKICPIPDEYRICADGYLMIAAPLVAREFGLIDAPLGFYRIHGENSFSTFGSADGLTQVKAPEITTHYNRLFLTHLVHLADKFDCRDIGMIKDLTSVCFKDALMATRERSGLVMALKALWDGRGLLHDLSHKHRLFRLTTLILQLLIPSGVYIRLQQLYANSPLWLFVQRHVKNDTRFFPPHQLPGEAEDKSFGVS